ncbi:hypothetical protein CCUS01_12452 [Colletotrichum cuscutae]|uniref:Uncharacterized protein n=1 Tax=Colletotrichum cuscutae TaxID=1209917 RepID=A0AAI9TWV4_9PEZI|nr:hypothetical protein CCUS01_12452 [Colletotrichum cuscutae]
MTPLCGLAFASPFLPHTFLTLLHVSGIILFAQSWTLEPAAKPSFTFSSPDRRYTPDDSRRCACMQVVVASQGQPWPILGPAGGASPRTRAEKVCCASEKGHHTINLVPVAAVPLHRLGSLQGPCIASAQSLMNLRPLSGLGIRSAEAVFFQ